MTIYLDASVLVSLFVRDRNSARAEVILRTTAPVLVVSDFAAAEFSSAVARRVRTADLTVQAARDAFVNFDGWTARSARRVETVAADVAQATSFVRRLDLPLRAPDALNIAITQRIGARLMTFDVGMEAAARTLNIPLLEQDTAGRPG
ncbi:Ribonuclease VapC46 [Rhodoplanes serenus]|uniref:Ribonuclease VapC n=1 Tax=Rhodoplanes serenus TaxID=200615 RepID=A0A447CSG1_9BRAD|nr:type II toxin-antitoxin system VapC family toxin [Rhodoplanes serenus]MBI5114476.1 type II toxin-antitoxin system VapC family toxin [Rhodovulum sp.]VCU08187.1 Ribonuclease VapC46 [Rhodoplanes serenus]